MKKQNLRNKKAFSIIEVVVSMTILALLIAGLSSSLAILLDVNLNNSLRVSMNNDLDLLIDQLEKDIGAAEYIYPCDSDNSITEITNSALDCLRFVYSGKQFEWKYDAANARLVKVVANGTTFATYANPQEKDSSNSQLVIKTAKPFEVKIYKIIDPLNNKIYNDVSIILSVVANSRYQKTDGQTPRVRGIFRQTILGTKNITN